MAIAKFGLYGILFDTILSDGNKMMHPCKPQVVNITNGSLKLLWLVDRHIHTEPVQTQGRDYI